MFNTNIISSSIIAPLCSMAAKMKDYDQENETKKIEVISVTGIRDSLA